MKDSQARILSYLTEASVRLQAAHELAREAGNEALAEAIHAAAMPTAAAISCSVRPTSSRAGEVVS